MSNGNKHFFIFAGIFLLSILFAISAYCETAIVNSVEGDVKIVPRGSTVGVECVEGMTLNAGDWIKTGVDSVVTVAFDKSVDNIVRIEENSLIILKLDGYFKIQLLTGEIYAILEGVEDGEVFRVLTPSVVTESMNAGWGASSDGAYGASTDGVFTNVMVFENEVYVSGIGEDGSINKQKYRIGEGYQRMTIALEDPGELEATSSELLSWFQEQVMAHHFNKMKQEKLAKGEGPGSQAGATSTSEAEREQAPNPTRGGGVFIADGEEINIVEYLYKQRLKH